MKSKQEQELQQVTSPAPGGDGRKGITEKGGVTMKQVRISVVTSVLVVLVVLVVGGSVQASDLKNYAFVHPFGLSSATTARAAALGGAISCVWDRGFSNPAYAAMQDRDNASVRWTTTDFDRGPDITSTHAHFVFPLKPGRDGMEISLFDLHSNSGQVPTPGGPYMDMSEKDIAIHYGRRIDASWCVGAGISPLSQIRLSMWAPGWVPIMDIKAESDWGTRLGAVYQRTLGEQWGVVYDYYQETAKGAGLAFGGGTARQVYHTDLLAVGVSKYLRRDLMVVAEYQRGRTFAGADDGTLCGWHFGAEYAPSPRFALRVGSNDGGLTAGVGYRGKRVEFSYAYIQDSNDDIAGDMFGGSDTHMIQAICVW
ncbi:MAG: hypothetical protein J7M26_02725 [Armatimonadetes bacterium]|nr:hypothetical protein [Armatimonadota bacterium]